jgi:hypothetical protein
MVLAFANDRTDPRNALDATNCSQCGERLKDSDAAECAMPGCRHTYLCRHCRFECVDCGKAFCREHRGACECLPEEYRAAGGAA